MLRQPFHFFQATGGGEVTLLPRHHVFKDAELHFWGADVARILRNFLATGGSTSTFPSWSLNPAICSLPQENCQRNIITIPVATEMSKYKHHIDNSPCGVSS